MLVCLLVGCFVLVFWLYYYYCLGVVLFWLAVGFLWVFVDCCLVLFGFLLDDSDCLGWFEWVVFWILGVCDLVWV